MKQASKLLLLAWLLFLGISTLEVCAQDDMEAYTWDNYGMGFSVPKTFDVLESDSSKFSASDSVMNLTIYPVDASGIDTSNMKSLIGQWAINNNVKILSDYQPFTDEGSYSGVLCVGELNSYNVMLMLMIDPVYSDIGFYIWISYNNDSFDRVLNVVDSFYPILE
jgi:hypothetical protein